MTGPAHYAAAERLLEHAAAMLDAGHGPERDREAELVQCQLAVATAAAAHAFLAVAATMGLTADLGPADAQAWREAAAAPIGG